MRDVHLLTSKKRLILDIDDATEIIRKFYPTAIKQGSVCAYHWEVNGMVVGEAWIHRSGKTWWLRIKDI